MGEDEDPLAVLLAQMARAGIPEEEARQWAENPSDLLSGAVPAEVLERDPERAWSAADRYVQQWWDWIAP